MDVEKFGGSFTPSRAAHCIDIQVYVVKHTLLSRDAMFHGCAKIVHGYAKIVQNGTVRDGACFHAVSFTRQGVKLHVKDVSFTTFGWLSIACRRVKA